MHGTEIQWRPIRLAYRLLPPPTVEAPVSPIPEEEQVHVEEEPVLVPPTPGASETTEQAAHASQNLADILLVRKELETLQDKYQSEVNQREAAQAEIAVLREELQTVARALEMSESRLKMMQLESDRPLWEEAKKKREEREEEELARKDKRRRQTELEESRRKMREFQVQEAERKVAEEARRKERRRREAEEKAKREKEEAERKAREKAETERKEREEREKRERAKRWMAATKKEEKRCQLRDIERWGTGEWTEARALERLRALMGEFEKIKFSEEQPLTFEVVPWPMLVDPFDMDVEQIDWNAVEAFFARAKGQLLANPADYKTLVERAHRMFHPDKWKARGLLSTVIDDALRKSLETAGNVVAQAMTPLWRKSKGYT
ncbi:hypothetical protein C8J57DRAFT_446031 [Mycena rebaudengoi]|nr:hypothetical protein C8J57DRAFT_446031 [Mycena rebaudengoi]